MPVPLLHQALTNEIIKAFYKVYNTLGYGFLEKVYENALALELADAGHHVLQQELIKVHYNQRVVGDYYADLIVDRLVIIELKVADAISEAFEAQLTNYLRATEIEIGLLLNCGPKPQMRRKIF